MVVWFIAKQVTTDDTQCLKIGKKVEECRIVVIHQICQSIFASKVFTVWYAVVQKQSTSVTKGAMAHACWVL